MYGRGAGVSISLRTSSGVSGAKAEADPSEPPPSLSRPNTGTRAPRRPLNATTAPSPIVPSPPTLSPTVAPAPDPAHWAPGPGPSVILAPRHGNPRPAPPRDATECLTLAQNVSLWKTIRHAPLLNLSNLRASALRHPGPFRVSRGARRVKPRRYDDKASLRPLRRPAELLPHRGRIEEGYTSRSGRNRRTHARTGTLR